MGKRGDGKSLKVSDQGTIAMGELGQASEPPPTTSAFKLPLYG